jgi:hypothetical protein
VRDLGSKFVEGERGDEANHAARDLHAHRNQIGVSQGGQVRKAIQTSAEGFEVTGVTHAVECFGVNPQA